MPGWGFKDKAIANKLKEMATRTLRVGELDAPQPARSSSKFALAVPDGVITAGSISSGGILTCGGGSVYLLRRDPGAATLCSQYPESTLDGLNLVYVTDPVSGDPIRRRVFNPSLFKFNPGDIDGLDSQALKVLPLLSIIEDIAGDLYLLSSVSANSIPFKNVSGEEAPAYAVMRFTTIDVDGYVNIEKPNDSLQRRYLINGPLAVANNATGFGTWLSHSPLGELVKVSGGTPLTGQEWGAIEDQWHLVIARPGFQIIGGYDADKGAVRAIQREVTELFGKPANYPFPKGDTEDVTVWMGDPLAASEYTISCTNKAIDINDNLLLSIGWRCNKWYCAPAECEI